MAYSPNYNATGVEKYQIPDFRFTSGGCPLPINIAYRSLNPSSSKKVLIPTCFGGIINNTLTFSKPNQCFHDHHIILVTMLGNGESSSPSNEPEFPQTLNYRDCINAQYILLTQHLHLKHIDIVAGFSMGGQQAYYWAAMYPGFISKGVIPICGSAKTSPHNWAFLEGPKSALVNSAAYANGAYKAQGLDPEPGVRAFARAYAAWLTSATWFREKKFETEMGFADVEAFIQGVAETAFLGWDPEDLLILARMWQAGDIGVLLEDHQSGDGGKGGDYREVLKKKVNGKKVLVMPSETDQYFRPEDSEVEVEYLEKGELAVIPTIWGHVAGGGVNEENTKWMSERIEKWLTS